MGTFSGGRTFRAASPGERMTKALDMPFGGSGLGGELANAGDQVAAGALSTYGLGSEIRNRLVPVGNTEQAPSFLERITSAVVPGGEAIRQGVIAARRALEPDQPSMSADDYKTSPYFRDEIPFEQGMTADRAAALAAFYDVRKTKEFFGQKRPWSTFAGQFVGQALDPVNYVPVFGQAAETAAVARLGTLAGRLVLGASDAAINTAAFGLLTSNMRSKFGDDVSWQGMVNEIGMSALVGGAFGGGIGLIHARRDFNFAREDASRARSRAALMADVQNGVANKENLMASRPVLNEAATSLALTGDVSLSPNSAAVIERVQADVQSRTEGARAIQRDTANVNATDAVAITPGGSRINVRTEVVDASTLVRASGDLQVRNRTNVASNTQIEDMAINLDPARLMPSVEADSGAPIVGPDNVIDSGNGRVGAIVRASQAYPAKYAGYRQALEAAGYDLTGIQTPVLINRRVTYLSHEARVQFNAEANAPRAAQMSAVELAAMDRSALTDGVLKELDGGPISGAGNRAFVARFLDNLGQTEKGALVDNVGNLNADGVRRIENALIASAYGDVDAGVIRRFAEATDDNTRAIVGAMSDVAGKWTLMRRSIKAGDISPEFDVTPELTDALRMIGQWRDQAAREKRPVSQVIKEGMAQIDMLSGEVSPETQVLIGAFYQSNSFARAAGRETIADFLGKVSDAATELGRPQLFETADVGKLELLKNVAVDGEGNLFTPAGTVDGIEADGGFNRATANAADRQGGGQAVGGDGRAADSVAAAQSAPSIGEKTVTTKRGDTYADTRGQGQQYHGSSKPIEPMSDGLMFDEGHYNNSNIYGNGFYSTDAVDIAAGYQRKGKGDAPIMYRVVENGPVKMFDMEAPLSQMSPALFKYITEDDSMFSQAYDSLMFGRNGAEPNLREVIDELRGISQGEGWSRDDVHEALDALRYNLTQEGFGGMSHTGGLKTDRPAHEVKIYFDPNRDITLQRMDTEQFKRDPNAKPQAENDTSPVDTAQTAAMADAQSTLDLGAEVPRATSAVFMPNDTVEVAAARVGKPDDIRQIAASVGVDPTTGAFVEQSDIAQLRDEGRLSPAAQAELDAADQAFDTGEAFGRALAAAVACIV